jgi:hypothetical protein
MMKRTTPIRGGVRFFNTLMAPLQVGFSDEPFPRHLDQFGQGGHLFRLIAYFNILFFDLTLLVTPGIIHNFSKNQVPIGSYFSIRYTF